MQIYKNKRIKRRTAGCPVWRADRYKHKNNSFPIIQSTIPYTPNTAANALKTACNTICQPDTRQIKAQTYSSSLDSTNIRNIKFSVAQSKTEIEIR